VLSDNFTDIDNNTGTGASTSNYMVDDIYPIVHGSPTITLDVDNRSNDELILWSQTTDCIAINSTSPCSRSVSSGGGGIATLTVNFQEPVIASYNADNVTTNEPSFSSSADIDLTNATGTLAFMRANSDNQSIWTGRFYPTPNIDWSYNQEIVDNNTITLKDSWTDQVGNPGTTVTTSSYEIDTYRPRATLTITVADNTTCDYSACNYLPALAPGDNGTLRVEFSDPNPEPIINFNSDDDIDNTSYVFLSTMTTIDNGTTWEGVFTPVDNSTGEASQVQDRQGDSYSIRLEVLDSSYNDNKSNPGVSAQSDPFIVDTKAPYVTQVTLNDGLDSLDDNLDGSAPFNNRCIPVHSDIRVKFDYYMNPSSITSNPSDSECTGTLQVSSDNFSTDDNCVKIAHPPLAVDNTTNKKFILDPVDNLSYNTTYTVRVETGVQDALENNMINQFNHTFRTSALHSSSPTSGAFLAVGAYGDTFRSIDNGTSWDNGTCIFLDHILNGVAYGNNTFVAVGNDGKIIKSTDNGSSWQITNSSGSHLNGVSFGNNTFVSVGNGDRIVTSTDNGSSWSSSSSGRTDHYFKGVTFGNDIFEVVGQTNWSRYYHPQNTYYVRIFKSIDDGSNWTSQVSPDNNTIDLYGISFGSNRFVAVGQGGKIVRSTNNSGTSWDNMTYGYAHFPYGNIYLRSVAFGNNTFVAVGQGGNILRSTNSGTSWTNSTSNTSSYLYGVSFGNNTFVAVGENGTIITSPDGITWTTRTSGTPQTLYGVTFSE